MTLSPDDSMAQCDIQQRFANVRSPKCLEIVAASKAKLNAQSHGDGAGKGNTIANGLVSNSEM